MNATFGWIIYALGD